jgi:hypothetical protein
VSDAKITTRDASVDSYVLAGDREAILVIDQFRHLSNQGRMSTRAFLDSKQLRSLGGELIKHADRIDAKETPQ